MAATAPSWCAPWPRGCPSSALFDAENREWTLDEIAERAGLPRMTAYRMIRTMESAWYLVRDPVTNRYHLGPALLATMYLSEGYAELAAIVRPYLQELTEKTGEAATLAIEVDGVAVSVDMVETTRPLRREVAIGRIIGDTASANGKVFAAFKSGAERAAILARPHPALTPNTITEPQVLAMELDRSWPRAWRSTSRSATRAPAPWPLRCATSWARSSRPSR